ncbi:MAG: hypothetical protein ACXWHZ_06350 [Usitatibacter sp.]
MSQPERPPRERLAEWIVIVGFGFLVTWPFVPVEFVVWVGAFAGVACVVAAAYVMAPDDSRIKSMFGRRTPDEHPVDRATDPPKG